MLYLYCPRYYENVKLINNIDLTENEFKFMSVPSHPLDIRMSADGKYIKYIEIYMFTPEVWPRTVKMDILDE